jgi:hypothetical protein
MGLACLLYPAAVTGLAALAVAGTFLLAWLTRVVVVLCVVLLAEAARWIRRLVAAPYAELPRVAMRTVEAATYAAAVAFVAWHQPWALLLCGLFRLILRPHPEDAAHRNTVRARAKARAALETRCALRSRGGEQLSRSAQ